MLYLYFDNELCHAMKADTGDFLPGSPHQDADTGGGRGLCGHLYGGAAFDGQHRRTGRRDDRGRFYR